jgi:ADP-ribose pyrophosphatase YjhB (NUDIX family)
MDKPIFKENGKWEGKPFTVELYASNKIEGIEPIKQVQAVCFDENKNVVLYKNKKGWNGLPGGHIEHSDKSLKDTLSREILEEIAAKLLDCKIIGYEKVWWNDDPKKVHYHIRYLARVKLLDALPSDPDGNSLERVICSKNEAFRKLGYGEKGLILLKLAYKSI